MSAGARPGTLLTEIEAEFTRITGLGLFHFPPWYARQMRALHASIESGYGSWPTTKAEQERELLEVLKATPGRTA